MCIDVFGDWTFNEEYISSFSFCCFLCGFFFLCCISVLFPDTEVEVDELSLVNELDGLIVVMVVSEWALLITWLLLFEDFLFHPAEFLFWRDLLFCCSILRHTFNYWTIWLSSSEFISLNFWILQIFCRLCHSYFSFVLRCRQCRPLMESNFHLQLLLLFHVVMILLLHYVMILFKTRGFYFINPM